MKRFPFDSDYSQSTAMDVTKTNHVRAMVAELDAIGWKISMIVHDEAEFDGPEATKAQAHEIIARYRVMESLR